MQSFRCVSMWFGKWRPAMPTIRSLLLLLTPCPAKQQWTESSFIGGRKQICACPANVHKPIVFFHCVVVEIEKFNRERKIMYKYRLKNYSSSRGGSCAGTMIRPHPFCPFTLVDILIIVVILVLILSVATAAATTEAFTWSPLHLLLSDM